MWKTHHFNFKSSCLASIFCWFSAHPLYFPQIPSSMPAVTGPCWFSPSLSSFPKPVAPCWGLMMGSCTHNSKLRTEKDNGNSENCKAKRNSVRLWYSYISWRSESSFFCFIIDWPRWISIPDGGNHSSCTGLSFLLQSSPRYWGINTLGEMKN